MDTQLSEPYRLWHHIHRFEECPEGTLMTDLAHYALPLGPLGGIARTLYVRHKLRRIFQYRRDALAAMFKGGILGL